MISEFSRAIIDSEKFLHDFPDGPYNLADFRNYTSQNLTQYIDVAKTVAFACHAFDLNNLRAICDIHLSAIDNDIPKDHITSWRDLFLSPELFTFPAFLGSRVFDYLTIEEIDEKYSVYDIAVFLIRLFEQGKEFHIFKSKHFNKNQSLMSTFLDYSVKYDRVDYVRMILPEFICNNNYFVESREMYDIFKNKNIRISYQSPVIYNDPEIFEEYTRTSNVPLDRFRFESIKYGSLSIFERLSEYSMRIHMTECYMYSASTSLSKFNEFIVKELIRIGLIKKRCRGRYVGRPNKINKKYYNFLTGNYLIPAKLPGYLKYPGMIFGEYLNDQEILNCPELAREVSNALLRNKRMISYPADIDFNF